MGPGLSGQIADLAQNVPFLGQLGDFSPTHALRWLLWLAAVLGSIFGIVAVLVGTLLIILAVGPVATSTNEVLGSASSGVFSLAGSLDGTSAMVANMSNVSSTMSGSLSNMSAGLGKTADSIESLKNLPGQGAGTNWIESASSLRSSSSGLQTAAAQARDAGSGGAQAAAGISSAAESLRTMSSGLLTTQNSISSAATYAQIGIACMGLAVAMLLGGVFALALAYGPPKKN